MKKFKTSFISCLVISLFFYALGCSALNMAESDHFFQTDMYTPIQEIEFINTSEENKSQISLTTSTASYSNLRKNIISGNPINVNSVKIEEMINYFNYNYPIPDATDPLSYCGTVIDTPWNESTKLMIFGVKAEEIIPHTTSNNIVFLVDVSSSMYGADRLGIAIEGLIMLTDCLKENDIVSMVTYAGQQKVVFEGERGENKERIKESLLSLTAKGSTAGSNAIEQAYKTADKYKSLCDNSTVIMITDGDFNVGINSTTALEQYILEQKSLGISLSVAGVGFGNMRNDILETIADSGGGTHAYLGSVMDARKFMVEELGAVLNIVARDVKAEIEFNTDTVAAYRIIGYENRQLSLEQWQDEGANAGAVGSGAEVSIIYEVKPTGTSGDYATLNVRYKNAKTMLSTEDNFVMSAGHAQSNTAIPAMISTENALFISAIVETGLILRNSEYKGNASLNSVHERLSSLDCTKSDLYKKDFLDLIKILKQKYQYN